MQKKNKKIILITTGQPSGNPRIVKEADALFNAGYEVVLLYCYFIDWAHEKDKELLSKVGWSYKLIGGTPTHNKLRFNFTRARFKIARILSKYLGNRFCIGERAQARAYDELLNAAKKIKADWYIGHNLGALSIAAKAAKLNNSKAGFDFEDYHRAEVELEDKDILKRTIYIEDKYVSMLHYFSAASDLILDAVKENHPKFAFNTIVLYNSFPLSLLSDNGKIIKEDSLKLFWFSQTIGLNRGLEIIIEALKLIKDKNIHLTLAGRCDENFKNYIEEHAAFLKNNIHFSGIISPNELPTFAAQFDVGLAVELSTPYNRDICLTNKIFTYLLAGNAIIFSGTAAQAKFNAENKTGIIYSQNNLEQLVQCINYFKNKENLEKQKKINKNLAASTFNWEMESEKLLKLIS